MNKKYELLKDDYIEYKGKTLYRIKALRDFGYIKKGELGGYIQSENNLSHEGDCWVYGNACIYDNAKVYDNARVFDNAFVYDNAKVSGYACIYDNAKVYENARVYEHARVYGYAEVYGDSCIRGNVNIHGKTLIHGDAKASGNINVNEGIIIGKVSMPYKDIFQYQCKNRMLTAILTEDDNILYTLGCQENITEEEFIYRIHNKNGGLKENLHRYEYLKLIPAINLYFRGE